MYLYFGWVSRRPCLVIARLHPVSSYSWYCTRNNLVNKLTGRRLVNSLPESGNKTSASLKFGGLRYTCLTTFMRCRKRPSNIGCTPSIVISCSKLLFFAISSPRPIVHDCSVDLADGTREIVYLGVVFCTHSLHGTSIKHSPFSSKVFMYSHFS